MLIPTLNEEASIVHAIERVPVNALSDLGYDTIYVIDGESEDATRQKALDKGTVVVPVTRPVKGAAMQHTFSSIRADYFTMTKGMIHIRPNELQIFCAFCAHPTSLSAHV